MTHSRTVQSKDVTIKVPPSRFKKILSDIRTLQGLSVEGFIERVCKDYNWFSFYSSDIKDKNGNHYTIIKDLSVPEVYGSCNGCNCNGKRWINSKTGICYYREDIETNFTTKIPKV